MNQQLELLVRKQRWLRLAVAAAVLLSCARFALVVMYEDALLGADSLTRARYGSTHPWALLLAAVGTALVSLFPGRSWTRALTAYTALMAMGMPGSIVELLKLTAAKEHRDHPAEIAQDVQENKRRARHEELRKEADAMNLEWLREPPLAPRNLTPEKLWENLQRCIRAIMIAAEVDALAAESEEALAGSIAAHDLDLARAVRRDTRRNLRALKALLDLLHGTFGYWRLGDGGAIQFDATVAQEHYQAALDELTRASNALNQSTSELRERLLRD